MRYLPLLTTEERLRYAVKLGRLQVSSPHTIALLLQLNTSSQEAAEAAFALKDVAALRELESKAASDPTLQDIIVTFRTKLQTGR